VDAVLALRLSAIGALENAMRLLINLVLCLVATVIVASGSAAVLFVVAESAPRKAPAQQKTSAVAPRVQAWLDRKAEELAYAEKEQAAALAEKERAEALQLEPPPAVEQATIPQVRNAEEDQVVRRERARRARQAAKQEARRQLRLQQAAALRAYGYVPERRWFRYPHEFRERRELNF
jgi:hypothetical protein